MGEDLESPDDAKLFAQTHPVVKPVEVAADRTDEKRERQERDPDASDRLIGNEEHISGQRCIEIVAAPDKQVATEENEKNC